MDFDLFGINKIPIGEDKQGDEEKQSYTRKFEVSPIFSFSNSATVAPGETNVLDFVTQKPKTEKYLPFNTLNIINNSTAPITVFINQNTERGIFVPGNTIQPIDSTIAPSINSLSWINEDGSTSITASQIQFIVSRDNVTTDLLAKRMHALLNRGVGLTRR